jgi:hypothetical protein
MPFPTKAEYEKATGKKMTDAEYKKVTSGPQDRDESAYDGAKLLESKDKTGTKAPVARPGMPAVGPRVVPLWQAEKHASEYAAKPAPFGNAQPMSQLELARAEQGGMLYTPPKAPAQTLEVGHVQKFAPVNPLQSASDAIVPHDTNSQSTMGETLPQPAPAWTPIQPTPLTPEERAKLAFGYGN